MSAPFEVIPSAHRLIQSLRDLGYDFVQAVADIVDNSINAKARHVSIDVVFDGDDSWVRIADNGRGMTPDELREAMRYGSKGKYDAEDLGKFGLGLKTASMSQCEHLIVASRWNRDRADIAAYAWDLDHIKQTDRWEILPVERTDLPHGIASHLREAPGTVVFWQRLDRILGFKHPYGEFARKRLLQMCRDLEIHLGMVFHRFLAGENPGRRLSISVNGNLVRPWDPFCREEAKTTPLQAKVLDLEFEGRSGQIRLEPFVLPHQSDYSTPDAFRVASGPLGWNQQQGFYIYRAGRLIQSGGWSSLRAPDEHTKLARIAVSFSPVLDEAFGINVAKMRVQLPGQIRDSVKEFISPLASLARKVYDRKQRHTQGEPPDDPQTGLVGLGGARSSVAGKSQSQPRLSKSALLTRQEWSTLLRRAALPTERSTIERVLRRMTES